VRRARKRFEATEAARANLLRKFTAAIEAADEKTLLALFAPDATWTADGGGRGAAATRPIVGAEQIAALVLGLRGRLHSDTATMELIDVNGEPGLCVRTNGRVTAVLALKQMASGSAPFTRCSIPTNFRCELSQPNLSDPSSLQRRGQMKQQSSRRRDHECPDQQPSGRASRDHYGIPAAGHRALAHQRACAR
jgi:ketosteroid isomerase-like protein